MLLSLAFEWTEKNGRRKGSLWRKPRPGQFQIKSIHIVVHRIQWGVSALAEGISFSSLVTTVMLQCLSQVYSAKNTIFLIMTEKILLEIK